MTGLLAIEGLVKRFGGLTVTDRLSLDVAPGELHALIGPNGAGKTSLIAQVAGELRPDAGRIVFDGADITRLPAAARVRRGLARTFQVAQLLPDNSALDNVAVAVLARQGYGVRIWADAHGDRSLVEPARAALASVGLEARADVPVADLSHGEQKQLELAVALATGPRALLLDEPMAGLGPTESSAMTRILAGLKGRIAMLLIEHDMDAVFSLADRISVLVYGHLIASGDAERIRADPQVRAAYLAEEDA